MEILNCRLLCVVFSLFIVSCRSEISDQAAAENWKYVEQEVAAESTANAGLNQIVYSACASVWDGAKVTPCGGRILSTALIECSLRASKWQGPRSSILDEFAGPSWVDTAGRSTVLSVVDRIKQMDHFSAVSNHEEIAIIVGEGTSDVVQYGCDLKDLRLQKVQRLSRLTVYR